MAEINTLSHAELSYQSNPCGELVDMDTVNIDGSNLPTEQKVQPCVISLWQSQSVHFKHLADYKGTYSECSKLQFLSHTQRYFGALGYKYHCNKADAQNPSTVLLLTCLRELRHGLKYMVVKSTNYSNP